MNSESSSVNIPLNGKTLLLIIAAGIAGEIVFEIIAWLVMPSILGRPMQPAMLVMGLAKSLLGLGVSKPMAFVFHLMAGAVIFPVGYVLFRNLVKIKSWLIAGIVWGVVLWFIAQGVLAPLVGRPFMLGFIAYTWAALVVHIIYTVVVALTFDKLSSDNSSQP